MAVVDAAVRESGEHPDAAITCSQRLVGYIAVTAQAQGLGYEWKICIHIRSHGPSQNPQRGESACRFPQETNVPCGVEASGS